MERYCVARNKPMRSKRTKPQTATVISLWFEGLLAYPELYCDSTFLKNFRCSRFSEFVSNAVIFLSILSFVGDLLLLSLVLTLFHFI